MTVSSSTLMPPLPNITVAGRYQLIRKIGSGSFGEVYLATDLNGGGNVAVKLEPIDARIPQLRYECKIYAKIRNGVGIPQLIYTGKQQQYNFLVMELLGSSLETLFDKCGRRFTLKTVLLLAIQILHRLEHLHSHYFIHRDIKPDNFIMGLGHHNNIVYMIDLGLSKEYRNPLTKEHIPFREGKSLTGTARYASINAHKGCEQGRRDDLLSLGYVLMYFLRGSLPWQGLRTKNKKDKYGRISQKKEETTIQELCKGYPREFVSYFDYCNSLKFDQTPDYGLLRKLFETALRRYCNSNNRYFEWNLSKSDHLTQVPVPSNGLW
ncbi:protein kinase domain-containing protein [Ditylenchus destructor]|nr:protein kinase domain-containing protein [Ditylenchus destructor]